MIATTTAATVDVAMTLTSLGSTVTLEETVVVTVVATVVATVTSVVVVEAATGATTGAATLLPLVLPTVLTQLLLAMLLLHARTNVLLAATIELRWVRSSTPRTNMPCMRLLVEEKHRSEATA